MSKEISIDRKKFLGAAAGGAAVAAASGPWVARAFSSSTQQGQARRPARQRRHPAVLDPRLDHAARRQHLRQGRQRRRDEPDADDGLPRRPELPRGSDRPRSVGAASGRLPGDVPVPEGARLRRDRVLPVHAERRLAARSGRGDPDEPERAAPADDRRDPRPAGQGRAEGVRHAHRQPQQHVRRDDGRPLGQRPDPDQQRPDPRLLDDRPGGRRHEPRDAGGPRQRERDDHDRLDRGGAALERRRRAPRALRGSSTSTTRSRTGSSSSIRWSTRS